MQCMIKEGRKALLPNLLPTNTAVPIQAAAISVMLHGNSGTICRPNSSAIGSSGGLSNICVISAVTTILGGYKPVSLEQRNYLLQYYFLVVGASVKGYKQKDIFFMR